ncbi:hypothetical protein FOC4_g10011180, partial [Fusarium odoratissimum]
NLKLISIGEGSSNNYAYLVVDDKSKDAVIVDPANPPEVAPILKDAIQAGKINLTAIVNTHHHWDHAGGNKKLLAELGNPKLDIIGGKDCEGVTKTPGHGETFKLGDITFKGVHTPCHTQDSICFFVEDGKDKAVFTGDTLFIGGCGRFFEGNAEEMHEALNKRLAALPDDTVVYPGHEYTKANVKFAASVSQRDAVQKLHSFAENNKVTTGKFTIGDEKEHNVFMRVEDPEIQKQTGETEPVAVMAKLREMKNNFKLRESEEDKKSSKSGTADTTMKDTEPDTGEADEEDDFGWSQLAISRPFPRQKIGFLSSALVAATRAMHIQSIPMWEGSSNNYAYLVVDDKSKDAVIVDPANPPEVAPILKDAIQAGKINLTAIVNTHHHWDHAGGNKKLLAELGNPKLDIIGGKDCEGVTKTPGHGETFKLGDITFKGVHTPCHTQDSICFFVEDGKDKAVFTGDTLFIGGCGRFFEGNAEEMHEALNKRLAALPDDTVVYPGHEYTKANVKFAASVSQRDAVQKLHSFAENNKVTTGKFTIGDEKEHNVFMRVEDPEIQKQTGETEPVAVMAKLREMKNNFKISQPPKRKAPATSATAAPKARQSKLAKEHNVTAQEEGEIREAFSLFAEPMDGEKHGVLPIDDVKSALIALGVPPSSHAELKEFISILDPENDGYATFEPFFAICALKFHTREHDSDAHRAEVEEAFRLFTNGQDGPITLAHLRRVAAVLKEDVDEELLKDMILEANGGVGVARGVGVEEFDGVMKSAGVWR